MRIRDLNATRDEIRKVRDRVAADLKSLAGLCASMEGEIKRRYYEEINRADGKTDGLEEFEAVSRLLKRDLQAVNGALGILTSKVDGASGYDFESMSEEGR